MGNLDKRSIGAAAENKARIFLEKNGLTFLEKNYACQFGEIDLIMQDGEYIVFVEVRLRNNEDYTSALESISKTKQYRISKTAIFYLIEKKWLNKMDCRFDVLAMDDTTIDWIKNAFDVEMTS